MRLLHEDHDFIERNGAWLLSMVAAVGACLSGLMVYMMRSRCTEIEFCGWKCKRDVLPPDSIKVEDVQVEQI